MKIFKFSAECSIDVINLIQTMQPDVVSYLSIIPAKGTPKLTNVDVVMFTILKKKELIKCMKEVVDSHVMLRTLEKLPKSYLESCCGSIN